MAPRASPRSFDFFFSYPLSLFSSETPALNKLSLNLSAPPPGDDLRSKSAIRLRGQNCTQRFFEGFTARAPTLRNCKWCPRACSDSRRRFFCGNDTIAVAMRCAMKNGQICSLSLSLRKFLAISSAIQKIASDCSCDAMVHLGGPEHVATSKVRKLCDSKSHPEKLVAIS